jgi:hypothetical protein
VAITRDQLSTLFNASTISGSPGVFTITFPTLPTAGATVIAEIAVNGTTISTVKDNGTSQSTLTLDVSEVGTSVHTIYTYRADGISLPSSGSYTLTVTLAAPGSGVSVSAGAATYLGKLAGGPVSTNVATATSTSVTTNNGTPSLAGSLFVAAFQNNSGGSADNPTVTNANFTSRLTQGNGGAGQVYGFADQIKSGSSADACTWTVGTSATYSAAIAVYSPAVVAVPPAALPPVSPPGRRAPGSIGRPWTPPPPSPQPYNSLIPGLPTATGTAQQPVAQVQAAPGAASSTATAQSPSITASGNASPSAASATATAQSPAVRITVIPGTAQATATALQPVAVGGTVVFPSAASATATAQSPSLAISTTVTPGVASATATAKTPVASLQVAPSAASATGAAQTPAHTVQVAPSAASSTAAALAPGAGPYITPPVAQATATAQTPAKTVTVQPSAASATATALSAGFPTPLKHWGVTFTDLGPAAVLTENNFGGTLTVPGFGAVLTTPGPNAVLILPNLGGSLAAPNYGATLSLANLSAVITGGTMQQASLTLSEFNDMTIDIAVTNNGSPFNLTGYNLNLLLKSAAGTPDSSALTFSSSGGSPAITVTSASAGLAVAQLPNADLDSEAYTFYRLDVVNASSQQQTTVYGQIIWVTL